MFDDLSFALVCLVCYGRCVGAPSGHRKAGEEARDARRERGPAEWWGVDDRWGLVRARSTSCVASRVAELSRFGAPEQLCAPRSVVSVAKQLVDCDVGIWSRESDPSTEERVEEEGRGGNSLGTIGRRRGAVRTTSLALRAEPCVRGSRGARRFSAPSLRLAGDPPPLPVVRARARSLSRSHLRPRGPRRFEECDSARRPHGRTVAAATKVRRRWVSGAVVAASCHGEGDPGCVCVRAWRSIEETRRSGRRTDDASGKCHSVIRAHG